MDPIRLILDTALFTLLCVSLILQLAARKRAGAPPPSTEDADHRRRLANQVGDLEGEVERLRAQVRALTAGATVTPEMVDEGVLWRDVTAAEALERVQQGARVLDVRTDREVRAGMVDGAVHIPVDQLEERLAEVPRGNPLVVYCAAGARSAAACEFLSTQPGFSELLNLETGFGSWTGPVVRP